jgi:hypothetical protein
MSQESAGQTVSKPDCQYHVLHVFRSTTLTLSSYEDVYFDRSTAGFSAEAEPRAKSAQLKLEHYYKVAVDSAIERNTRSSIVRYVLPRRSYSTSLADRRVALERRLQGEMLMSEERKQRHLQQLGKKESTFLRLRRTKLGLEDFRTVKVIGKGAFGEASVPSCRLNMFLDGILI